MRSSLIIPILTLLAACSPSPKENDPAKKDQASKDAKAVLVVRRAKPKITQASSPTILKVSSPVSFPANTNVIPAEELTSVASSDKLPMRTPGTDTLGLPKTYSVSLKKKLIKQSLPVRALPPRYKDAAISNIQYLDVDQGMISSMVKCVASDKNGNLWIGTNGAGASRYDGRSFFHYNDKNGLSNNTILCILQDSKGRIWFGTEGGGACCYDGESFFTLGEDEGVGSTVLAICEDKEGKIWFGTNGNGICVYNGTNVSVYTEKEGLNHNSIRCIMQDNKGNMWFGTTGSGACKFDGKSFYYFSEDEGLSSTIIHSIIQDKHGNMYFATDDGGVNIYDGKSVEYITRKRGLGSDCVISILVDQDENLWIGTYDGGLSMYNGHEIRNYNTEHGLTNNYVLSICEDHSGSLWLATLGGGVCRFNNRSFMHYTEKEGMGRNTVRSIVENKQGNLCLSTYGDGIILYNGKSFDHYTEKGGLTADRYKTSIADSNGVWFATESSGAIYYNGKTWTSYDESTGLNSNYILSMCVDKDNHVWFGTDEYGVSCFDGKQFISFMDEAGLSDGIITAIIQDRSGHMWFATEGSGVCNFDGEFFKWYTVKSGLCSDYINCMYQDKDGNVWFGSDGRGVSMLKAKTINSNSPDFENLSVKEGLSNDYVRSIVQDRSGNMWIGSDKGLNYIVKTENGKEVHVYTSADGLKANNFFNAVTIDSKNTIWWGNGKSLTNLNLNTYKIPNTIPHMQLNSIELDKSFVDFNSLKDTARLGERLVVGEKDKKDLRKLTFDKVEKFYNYPMGLVLPHNINQVEFEFSALDWAGPDKIHYQYMLTGADEDWSPLSTENKAFYSNISNGDYTFKVKAVGIAGNWSEVFSYSFTVKPPWYKHPVAYVGYIVLFILIVFGFNNIRTRSLKERQQELEKMVDERTAEVVEQKELIEEKQKEIVDSINYAKRIQSAMLASEHLFSKNLKNYFVLFRPKDIVSGDFYWASPVPGGKFVLVTADSTGHGVPGAMMSMLNISCLNEAINERKLAAPSAILDHARTRIISSLAEDGSAEGGKDGMDCSVIVFDFEKKKMKIAMANNPVWIIRKKGGVEKPVGENITYFPLEDPKNAFTAEIIELKPNRMPVGKHTRDGIPFTEIELDVVPGDVVYALTDGFCDQFGGPKQKKYTYSRLKEELLKIYTKESKDQKEHLDLCFESWKGNLEQVDDVLIIGVKV
jgi:ligand-binding sensor domain-containing protein/serine phosphatase RsbU (regulator of sigma subunit)